MKKEKEIITQKPGAFLLWITGLAGAGKTTVGKKVKAILDNLDVKVVHLDGDVFRKINNNRFGYTKEDRLKNALALAKLSHLLLRQGVNVICTTVSLFDEVYLLNKKNIPDVITVFLKCDTKELRRRNKKNLYRGKNKNKSPVVGLNLEYDMPKSISLLLDNTKKKSLDRNIDQVMQMLKKRHFQ